MQHRMKAFAMQLSAVESQLSFVASTRSAPRVRTTAIVAVTPVRGRGKDHAEQHGWGRP